jgi:3-isopropylmalate dehydratase small subunit
MSDDMQFKSRIWKFDDNINTDLILPNVAFYLTPQEQLDYIFRANRRAGSISCNPATF